ncbi:MAG TPA: EAL domain-containing protein [Clostridiales bacterium]|nr:EAL domain-containing protein [Clostridiales bacterium]
MELLSFVAPVEWALVFQKLKYIGVALVPPVLLVTVLLFSKRYQRIRPSHKILIYIIPFLSLVSIVTGCIPYVFLTNPEIYFNNGVPVFTYTKDIGFLVNTFYSYTLILISCYLLLTRALESPRIYRKQSIFVFFGCLVSFIINVLFVTQQVFIPPIDTTPVLILITLSVFYWGIYQLPKAVIVPYARDMVIENIRDMLFVLDNDECIIDINPRGMEFLWKNADEKLKKQDHVSKLIGMSIYDVVKHIPGAEGLSLPLDTGEEGTIVLQEEGRSFYYNINEEEIYDADRCKIGKLYLLHDITEIKEQLNSLMKLNGELTVSDKIINEAIEGIIITDEDNKIIRVNESMVKMSGYTREELIGNNPRLFKSDYHDELFYRQMWEQIVTKGFWEGEIWDKRKTGEIYPKWMTITVIKHPEGGVINYIGISSDMTKMKKAEQDIHLLAYYDSLSGLPNRTLFYDRLNMALARMKRSGSNVAVFYMDIDRFKLINDSLGHDVGDMLLVEAAKRIQSAIRKEDMLSRMGGDEFALLMEDDNCLESASSVAENILEQMKKPFILKDKAVSVGISIGIAVSPYDDGTLEGVLRKADSAMYHSKELGGGQYVFSSEEIEKRNQEQLELLVRLKDALQNEEFELFLQPQMEFTENRYNIVGAEALIRWNKDGVIIPPSRFIPVSEENGLILPISNWIIKDIFRIDRLLKECGINIKLAINVSVKQFEGMELVRLLQQMISEHAGQDIRLIIEITESMFIDDLDRAIDYLREIKALGISIALDDFGTGYSSLSYLTKLPIDYLKIDQSFVSGLDDIQNKYLTYSIISMAKILNLKTLAEGVETRDQAKMLAEKDCDELQGYYFSKPVPVDEFIAFYHEWMQKDILILHK